VLIGTPLGSEEGSNDGISLGDVDGSRVGRFVGERVGASVTIGQHCSIHLGGRGEPSVGHRAVQLGGEGMLAVTEQKSTQPAGRVALIVVGHAFAQVNGFNGKGVLPLGQ
jgi:hypothetical protein